MTANVATAAPLDRLRVLDLSGYFGALSTRLLAGVGADVIRIEPPGGHQSRRTAPFYHGVPHPERSLYWFQHNAGKRSITLNPATADGRALFLRLAETAAIVVESQEVGALDRAGAGFAALAARNPALVMVSISLYGQDGPRAADPGSDLIGMAAGGLMYLCGDRDRPPVRVTAEQANAQAGLHGAVAALIGLNIARSEGAAVHMDVSVQQTIVTAVANNRMLWPAKGAITHRTGGGRAGGPGRRLIYAAADGFIGFYRRPENWRDIQRWLDRAGIKLDFRVDAWQGKPAFGEGAPPEAQEAQLEAALERYFVSRPSAALHTEGQDFGLYVTQASSAKDLVESAQLAARDFWAAVPHPELGETLRYPGAPFRMSATPWLSGPRPPRIGEHNHAIYAGELGLSLADMRLLAAVGAI